MPRITVCSTGARSARPSAKKLDSAWGRSFGWSFMPGKAHSGNTSMGGEVNVVPRNPKMETKSTQTNAVTR
jgi:hypothetical protein